MMKSPTQDGVGGCLQHAQTLHDATQNVNAVTSSQKNCTVPSLLI